MKIQCEHGGGDCTLSVYSAGGQWVQFQSPRATEMQREEGGCKHGQKEQLE